MREVFRIRGHHLLEYMFLVKQLVSPEGLAQMSASYYEYRLKEEKDPREIALNKDTVGTTKRQLEQYKIKHRQLSEEFIALSPDFPIEIVEGKKDDICNYAITGKGEHCTARHFNPNKPKNDGIDGDGVFLDKFLQKAQELNLGSHLVLDHEVAEFSDAQPQQVRVIKTSAGILREIFEKLGSVRFGFLIS